MKQNIIKLAIKNKYLFLYVVYGFLSLIIEFLSLQSLSIFFTTNNINFISVLVGILFAAVVNLNFNFNVPRKKYLLSIFYFFIISLSSYFVQIFIANNIGDILPSSDFVSRLIISSLFFLIFYFFHINFSFSNTVKVGFAIHPNDKMQIDKNFTEAFKYADFLHIDIIDESYNENNVSNNLAVVKELIKSAESKNIQIHIMSQNPIRYIDSINNQNVDYFIHEDEWNNILKLDEFRSSQNVGIVINNPKIDTDYTKSILSAFNKIMILCVDQPGYSGQKFNTEYFDLIDTLVSLKTKNHEITIDGGINNFNVKNFNVDKVVSQSFIIQSNNPIDKIAVLKEQHKYG